MTAVVTVLIAQFEDNFDDALAVAPAYSDRHDEPLEAVPSVTGPGPGPGARAAAAGAHSARWVRTDSDLPTVPQALTR